MVLQGEDVIRIWQEMAGPENPEEAKVMAPMSYVYLLFFLKSTTFLKKLFFFTFSLRALFGTDKIHNAVYASANADEALFEIQGLFASQLTQKGGSLTHLFESRRQSLASRASIRRSVGNELDDVPGVPRRSLSINSGGGSGGISGARQPSTSRSKSAFARTIEINPALQEEQETKAPNQRTLALIKPDVYPLKKDEIVEMMLNDGFEIVAQKEVQWTVDDASAFYKEHEGKTFFEELVAWMSSAPIYALVLEREDGIKAWRSLAGPTNSEKAREIAPKSVRALFGKDGSMNAVHGSDSTASAAREIKLVFGGEVDPMIQQAEAAISAPALVASRSSAPAHTSTATDSIPAEETSPAVKSIPATPKKSVSSSELPATENPGVQSNESESKEALV